MEKYDGILENVMLKNSKCVINICCYAPRRMYTHNAHPCFEWYIPGKSPILRELLNVQSGNINGGFSCIFGRLKVWICKIMGYEGWSIINWCMNGVHEWDWVHERFLCPRAAPSGINNRSCTQSHSWTPNLFGNPCTLPKKMAVPLWRRILQRTISLSISQCGVCLLVLAKQLKIFCFCLFCFFLNFFFICLFVCLF